MLSRMQKFFLILAMFVEAKNLLSSNGGTFKHLAVFEWRLDFALSIFVG